MNSKLVLLIAGLGLMGLISPAGAAIPTSERDALIALYQSTAGGGWDHRDNWRNSGDTDFNDPGTECTWYGVQCFDGDTFVEEVILSDDHLVGTIPAGIGGLDHMTRLDLDHNELSGTIPSEIGDLSGLEVLHLQFNADLGGAIPPEIGNLTLLTNLGIFNTGISGEIPVELGSLSSLKSLNLSNNDLSGTIPAEVGDLSALMYLDFYGNDLEGSIPAEIGLLSHLIELDLTGNELSGPLPSEFGNLISIEELKLNFNHLNGELPASLTGLYKLSDLSIVRNEFTGTIPPGLGNLPDLVVLNLGGNHFSGEIPPEIGNLRNVGRIDFIGNMFNGEIPPELANITLSNPNCHCIEIQYNALYSDDPDLVAFLNEHQYMFPWDTNQTVPPENAHIVSIRETSVMLGWDEALYPTYSGGFELYWRISGFEDWTRQTFTSPRSETSFVIAGLEPGFNYDFIVRGFSDPNNDNHNRVVGDPSMVVTGLTGDSGCLAPTVSVTGHDPWSLTVNEDFDFYRWSTGDYGQTIEVSPDVPTWYWVETSITGPCDEYATVLVEPARIFSDGFEDGDSQAWSGTQN